MPNPNLKENKLKRAILVPFRGVVKAISKTWYVKSQYKYITHHKLNLKNPVRYTEKLQYLRLFVYPKNPLVSQCAGRAGVREYVNKKGFADKLIPIYGIFDSFKDIDFEKLPDQFVPIKPQIIIEKYLEENGKLPIEYKIHVFNGKARNMYVVTSRGIDIRYNNYYIDWTPFDGSQFNGWKKTDYPLEKPDHWNDMVEMAEILAKPFPFVRVDLYNINGKIYFSEMTFTPAKGTLILDDDKCDFEMGEWLDISEFINAK